MPLEPGHQLGPYQIQALLGVGGMGEVYRGRDSRLGRDVALKVISEKLIGDPESRRRFELEARAASVLNHPSIVTIYDVGETGGVSWIAMEWVEGRTLRQVLAHGSLPIREAWAIGRQIADGLAAAHAKGIVHRDLKPENVMVTADGRAKILDFGLARQTVVETMQENAARETAVPVAATHAGAIFGTVGYMSPEQASGKPVDFRSDQFLFGLLMYELLAGERAFDRGSVVETLAAVIREDPVPLASIRPRISDALHAVISKCLAKFPDDRFASTRDLAATLDTLDPEGPARQSEIDRGAAPTRAVLPGPLPRPSRSRATTRAAIMFATMLTIGVTVALAMIAWNRFSVPAAPAIQSLAVLPFENAGSDPETDYLSDGLTESLISHLSRVPSLKVMARGTVSRFKGLANPQEAGRTLHVGAVVTGTVTRRGDQVSISAELIDSASGERLWGQTYDRPFTDFLSVQDRIVVEISDGLRLHLSGQEKQRLAGSGTGNVEAYELMLKGQYLMANDTEEDDLEARKLFQQALEKDPNYLEARLDLAGTYGRMAGNGYAPTSVALALSGVEIRKAAALNPNHIGVRSANAAHDFQATWDFAAAARDYGALRDDPRLVLGFQFHPVTLFYVAVGQPEEAVAITERALVVDPGNSETRVMLGNFLVQAGRLDDALKVYNAIAADDPKDPRPLQGAADIYHRRGEFARASEARRKAYELDGDDESAQRFASATTEATYDKAEIAVARLRLKELEALAKQRYVAPIDLARLHALAGESEQAFGALELAMNEHAVGLELLKVDRAWDKIRLDPRFAAIVKRIGIP